jgi:uncharacterized protein YebE (UPF0316 family)
MIKILIIFILGLIEQIGYTFYLLAVDKRQVKLSSIVMFFYMLFYLGIIAYAIKDSNTLSLLITYALACSLGNYIVMKFEVRKKYENSKVI